MHDLVIRGAQTDIAIEGECIVAAAPELAGGREEIDARGLSVLPAVIDIHVHFNEPGRAEWEGAATGSRALAAGGGALFFDMPLNSSPCTVNAKAFREKRAALERESITDFALWGGIIPGNLADMADLAECGVIGFKAFMADSGLPEFPRADDFTLFRGMQEAARFGLPVAVHAENNEITSGMAREAAWLGRTSMQDYLQSRPVIAEVEAIERAGLMARETGCKLHIVHISSGAGVTAALEARARGADISIETCAHYLHFTEEDALRIGAAAKCAPPLRPAEVRDQLRDHLQARHIDVVGSDHSPAPASMKTGEDFFAIWGGVAGVQSTLAVLLTLGVPMEEIARLTSGFAATRFGLRDRGSIEPGKLADLVLVDPTASGTLTEDQLFQRHKITPYLGREFRGRVRRTILRGQTIYRDGKITAATKGQFARPDSTYATSRTHS